MVEIPRFSGGWLVLGGGRASSSSSDLGRAASVGVCSEVPVQGGLYDDRFAWPAREEHETFAHVYGYDLMQWPGYPLLADVREFIMVTWIISKANEDERISSEARKRLHALRAGVGRRDWNPF